MEASADVEDGLPGRMLLAVMVLALVIPGYLIVGGATQLLNVSFGLWFTELFVFLGISWVLIQMSRRNPVPYVRLRYPGLAPLGLGLGLGTVNYFGAVIPIQALAVQWSPQFLKNLVPDVSQVFEQRSPLELVLLLGAVSVAAPLCEELCFRGVIQQGFERLGAPSRGQRRRAIFWTAVLFSAFHLDPVGFWARLELGIVFGWLYAETGSLWTGVLAHAGNNLTATALYFLVQDSNADDASTPPKQILLFAAFGAAALVGAAWLLRNFPVLKRTTLMDMGPRVREDRPVLYRLAAPWLAAGVLSLGMLFAVDSRGVRLNLSDALRHEPPTPKKETLQQKAARTALEELRRQARSGRLPVEEYVKRRDAATGQPGR